MALTTTARIIRLLGVVDPTPDETEVIDSCREGAEAFLQEYLNRSLEKTRRTEYYTGNGHRVFHLRQRPVWQIHSLWLDHYGFYGVPSGSFDNTATLLTPGVDYVLDQDQATPSTTGPLSRSGVVVRQKTVWPQMDRNYVPGRVSTEAGPSFGNLKVDYTAGYEELPNDLLMVVAMLTALFKKLLPHGQLLESERIGSYSYTILTGRQMQSTHPVMGSIDRILTKYKEVAF